MDDASPPPTSATEPTAPMAAPDAPPLSAPPTQPGVLGDAEYRDHRYWRCPSCGQPVDVDRGAHACAECGMPVSAMRELRAFDDTWRSRQWPWLITLIVFAGLVTISQFVSLMTGTLSVATGVLLAAPPIASACTRGTSAVARGLVVWMVFHGLTSVMMQQFESVPSGRRLLESSALEGFAVTGSVLAVVLGALTLIRRRGTPSLGVGVVLSASAIPLTMVERLAFDHVLATSLIALITGSVVLIGSMTHLAKHLHAHRIRRAMRFVGPLFTLAYAVPILLHPLGTAHLQLGRGPITLELVFATMALATVLTCAGLITVSAVVLARRLPENRWRFCAGDRELIRDQTHVPATSKLSSSTPSAGAETAEAPRLNTSSQHAESTDRDRS